MRDMCSTRAALPCISSFDYCLILIHHRLLNCGIVLIRQHSIIFSVSRRGVSSQKAKVKYSRNR
jgi:hypothetical protein